ncbi:MAG: lipopolysaccharide kinase InaA family protein [Verrucomicrobiota bacterium]
MKQPLLSKKTLLGNPSEWISVSAGKWTWQINCHFNSPGLLRHLENPEELMNSAELLRKDARPRNTLIVRRTLPDFHSSPLIIKRYRPVNFLDSLKEGARSSRAVSAFEKAFALLNRNIFTATPIAASHTRRRLGRFESYLITEQIPNARPLREFRRGNFSARENQIVIRRLAETIAQLHNDGLSHTDPTLSNFFVQDAARAKFRIVLIDLDGLRSCGKVSLQKAADDLFPLFRRIPMSPREKNWFAAQYCRTRTDSVSSRELLSVLAAKAAADLKKPRTTEIVRSEKIHWRMRRGALHPKILAVMKEPESFLKSRELYFKNSRVVTVTRVPASVPGEPNLVLRRLKYGKLGHQIKDAFRASRARRALQHGLMLEKNGISTPRAFAAADVRQIRWPTAAYLITEQIPNAQTLARFLTQHPTSNRALAQRLADLLARMHNKGFSHRDLKSSNILLDGDLNPFLIDLDGLRVWKTLTIQRAVADLARFAQGISRHEKKLRLVQWRFLKRYCQQREPTLCVRELATQIAAKLSG